MNFLNCRSLMYMIMYLRKSLGEITQETLDAKFFHPLLFDLKCVWILWDDEVDLPKSGSFRTQNAHTNGHLGNGNSMCRNRWRWWSIFYYLMIIMPILALAAYIYDASTLFKSNDETGGLLSSILFIFYFLQYSVTIESKWLLTGYQFLLWIMVTAGDVVYVLYYFRENNQVQWIRYIGYILLDSVFNLALWSCKMAAVCKAHNRDCWCCIKVFQSLKLNT